ncbi:hypothetical protein A7982_13906 [Minicystis rosea]|nr:hypothetical protein A7982_13906 [Minicystis rosea]
MSSSGQGAPAGLPARRTVGSPTTIPVQDAMVLHHDAMVAV